LKMREGYDRIATNNIIINNGLHPHVWYLNSGDVFKNNIVFKTYQPAIMDNAIPKNGKWGKEVDYNFYVTNKETMNLYAGNDCDKNSVNGDPLFIAPEKCDFRVKENSPALKLGFVNFPMNNFGVTKPSLKAIAKTPEIPMISINIDANARPANKQAFSWMGVLLKEPVGDELSAFGVGFDSGGVALTSVPENSMAAKFGFKSHDLIREINESKIKTIDILKEYLRIKKDVKHHVITVIRNQESIKLTINETLPNI